MPNPRVLIFVAIDSLRVQVDTLQARDAIAYRVLADTRHDLDAQRDLLLSTRASSGSTMQEMFDFNRSPSLATAITPAPPPSASDPGCPFKP